MTEHPFLTAHDFCRRHRWTLLAASSLAALAAALSLFLVRYDKTLDCMLPARSSIPRMMEVMNDAELSSKIAISVGCDTPGIPQESILATADRFAADLAASPLITRVTSDFSHTASFDDMALFVRVAPSLLDEQDLTEISAAMTPEGVRAALRRQYVQLMKPEGSFLAEAIRADPLGYRWRIVDRLQALSTSFGYNIDMVEGHVVSRDGRHCMIMAETSIPPTDNTRAKQLAEWLDSHAQALPRGFSAEMLCAHLHTASNERTIKRDVALTNTVASIAFLLLFGVVFRDARAVFTLFAIPVAASLIAIPLTAVLFGRAALIVVGLGSVIAGVSVDYAMHVYVAARRSGNAAEALMHVALPVSLGALTTCGMFLAFFSSSVPGYHQLAVFSIFSIGLALLFALMVFPHFVKPAEIRVREETLATAAASGARFPRIVTGLWAVLFVLCLWLGRTIGFDSDILRMDGTESRILQGEQRFYSIWGRGETNLAIVVCEGSTAEEAQAACDAIYGGLRAAGAASGTTTLSSVWPATATRQRNLARWQAFWSPDRVSQLRKLLSDEGQAFGFAPHAFDPFFDSLATVPDTTGAAATNAVLLRMTGSFLQRKGDRWQGFLFCPDTPVIRKLVHDLNREGRQSILVSSRALAGSLSQIYSSEVLRISAVAGTIIVLLTFAMVRNIRIVLISLIPSASAVAAMLGVMALGGKQMDMANVFAGIVVFGLSLDYGFVMMHSYRHRLASDTTTSVHVSAITTVIGVAALLLARHPVLFSMGRTLTIGILAGYVTAMWVVPALYTLWVQPSRQVTT